MRGYQLFLALVACAVVPIFGQECPRTSATGVPVASKIRTFEGRLVFHNGIRKWFELKLDQTQCGQNSTELVPKDQTLTPLEVLRGCRVKARGAITYPLTGYYSLETYLAVEQIESIDACTKQEPFPDYSKAKPDKAIRKYRVDMQVDYEPGDRPIVFRVSSGGKELRPWQAYASYELTGGFVLYGHCGEGFVIDQVFGTPQAGPSHFDNPRTIADMAAFDPESAAASGIKELHLGYTCVRNR